MRKEVPAPKAGELPLPKSVSDTAGAPIIPASAVYAGPSAAPFDLAARLAGFPQWGELPWPKGAVPAQPAHDARGVMPFKVRRGRRGYISPGLGMRHVEGLQDEVVCVLLLLLS